MIHSYVLSELEAPVWFTVNDTITNCSVKLRNLLRKQQTDSRLIEL